MSFSANARDGSLMVAVVFVMLMLSLIVIGYFRVATSRHSIDLQLEQREMARTMADVGVREAIERISASLFDNNKPEFQFLVSGVPGRRHDLELPLSTAASASILSRGYALKLACELEILAFSNLDHQNQPYLVDKEGHGIVQIKVVAEIQRSGSARAVTSELVSVHDYVVSSMTFDEFLPTMTDASTAIFEHPLVLRSNVGHIEFSQASLDGVEINIDGNLNNPMASYWSALIPDEFYRRYALWSFRSARLEDLVAAKVICHTHKRLNINGIIHCRESVAFAGNWTVRGRGVLIANGFVFNGTLLKERSDDFIIIYAPTSNVVLGGAGPVQAGIIAAAGSRLIVKDRLNVEGFVVADTIKFDSFTAKEHQISYDPVFAQLPDQLCVSLSKWPNQLQENVAWQVSK